MFRTTRVTPLRIFLESKEQIGTGRHNGEEIIPYTPYAGKRYANMNTTLPLPSSSIIDSGITQGLRPYQITDLETLINRTASANFSEPRTGKTPTALRLFKAKGLRKIIIVTTAASIYQWKGEFIRWYEGKAEAITPNLSLVKRKKLVKQWGKDFEAIIVSYESLRVVTRQGKETGLLLDIIKFKDIDGIIVDEAHRIRNPKSLQAKAVFRLSHIPNRHILTGTPAHGRLENTYALLHFLYPTIFTGYWRFINYYFRTFKMFAQSREYIEIGGLLNPEELPQFIDRIAVQHKRHEVMPWLPEKDYQQIKLPPTKEQEKYLKQLEEEFEIEHIMVENVLTQLMRARQICNAPELLGLKGKSPKMEWLREYLDENQDIPIIIFSNFTSFIKLASAQLKINDIIIGETSSKKREEVKQAFQNGDINVLFINTQAGKEALTLDRAQVAIFLDIYPPYGDIDQAENRFTATTEQLKDKPHLIIQLMIEGTYDEELFALVKARASETEIVNSYKQHLERRKNVPTSRVVEDSR